MSGWLRLALGLVLAAAFVGLFWMASRSVPVGWGAPVHAPTPEPVKHGNYGRYLYDLTNLASQNKKMAQFEPTLPPEDAVVIEALKILARDGFDVFIAEDKQPAVEAIDETNYITFTVGRDKVLFELFRNSSGQVGTVRFWKQ